MVAVRIKVSGLEQMQRRTAAMHARAADLSPVLAPAAQTLVTVIQKDSFGAQSTPGGKPWAELADSTIARRRNKGRISILQDTGQMKSSVFARAIGGTRIQFGSSDKAAKVNTHLFGSKDVPARPFLPVDESGTVDFESGRARTWRERLVARIRRYIETGRVT